MAMMALVTRGTAGRTRCAARNRLAHQVRLLIFVCKFPVCFLCCFHFHAFAVKLTFKPIHHFFSQASICITVLKGTLSLSSSASSVLRVDMEQSQGCALRPALVCVVQVTTVRLARSPTRPSPVGERNSTVRRAPPDRSPQPLVGLP